MAYFEGRGYRYDDRNSVRIACGKIKCEQSSYGVADDGMKLFDS